MIDTHDEYVVCASRALRLCCTGHPATLFSLRHRETRVSISRRGVRTMSSRTTIFTCNGTRIQEVRYRACGVLITSTADALAGNNSCSRGAVRRALSAGGNISQYKTLYTQNEIVNYCTNRFGQELSLVTLAWLCRSIRAGMSMFSWCVRVTLGCKIASFQTIYSYEGQANISGEGFVAEGRTHPFGAVVPDNY